jgi:hypothetical protein
VGCYKGLSLWEGGRSSLESAERNLCVTWVLVSEVSRGVLTAEC